MSPRRFQLDGASLGEVKQRVLDEYGPEARIVAVEQVTTGGLGGFFATRRFEVTVEIADTGGEAIDVHQLGTDRRVGLAALLDDADAAELGGAAARPGATVPDAAARGGARARPAAASAAASSAPLAGAPVSTASREFAAVLDGLTAVTEAPSPELPLVGGPVAMPAAVPRLLGGVGDLVVVAGFASDALAVARAMSFTVQADVVVAGAAIAEGLVRIDGRRDSITARARGVERERFVIAAFGLTPGETVAEQARKLAELRADQLWIAVDAGRKPDDTARWVAALAAVVRPDGVAGVGREATVSPESVRELGLPVSWAYDG